MMRNDLSFECLLGVRPSNLLYRQILQFSTAIADVATMCGASSAYSITATFCSNEGLIIRSVFPNSARLIPGAGLSFDWRAAIPKRVIFDQ